MSEPAPSQPDTRVLERIDGTDTRENTEIAALIAAWARLRTENTLAARGEFLDQYAPVLYRRANAQWSLARGQKDPRAAIKRYVDFGALKTQAAVCKGAATVAQWVAARWS